MSYLSREIYTRHVVASSVILQVVIVILATIHANWSVKGAQTETTAIIVILLVYVFGVVCTGPLR